MKVRRTWHEQTNGKRANKEAARGHNSDKHWLGAIQAGRQARALGAQVKFPSSPEIKRVIAAARNAGVQIGSVDIRADGVTIHPLVENHAGMTPYEKWVARDTRAARN